MMLHEAVMLEIYRQALNASELASPRCQSRESNASGGAGDGRCQSNDSQCSGNDYITSVPSQTSPSVGLPLPATLAPAAAVTLLPPQSAAMAAYFNAAAVAAQQNHLLLSNPLAAAASLVQQATQSQSPTATRLTSSSSPSGIVDSAILDFSTKQSRRLSDNCSEGALDEEKNYNEIDSSDLISDDANSPLDLSVSARRKRPYFDEEHFLQKRKMTRTSDIKPVLHSTWIPPINPYLAAVAGASLSPKTSLTVDWNVKQQKILPNEATKALEKMTEMTRLGSVTDTEVPVRQISSTSSISASSSNGRHSAWQSHWLNKGADAVKDVFKCVWCKESFPTLASLTTHMKETQHCGVNVPPTAAAAAPIPTSNIGNQAGHSANHSRHSSTQSMANNSSTVTSTSSNKSDINLLIKENMPLPRKLVRGQDVWLGKGAEQTRQILKCMWCGQSFRSLAEMTSHMQETQHYTNIISQEQIISWKSTDDKSSSGGSSNGTPISPAVTSPSSAPANTNTLTPTVNAPTSNSTVSAVLTCKVCDQAFLSLKELSNHMVKNSHYKEHMIRSASDNTTNVPKRGRQAREKRKKSLPVRKLLELERAQQDLNSNNIDPALKPLRDFAGSTKITCEKCGDKIETALFVDHIRQCLGGNIPMSPRHNNLKAPYAPPIKSIDRLISPHTSSSHSDGRKTAEGNVSPTRPDILCPLRKDGEKSSSTPSVLNAIEQLIEKSFDTRSRYGNSFLGGSQSNTPLGSSILKRLGIDDSVDYTKPLIDPQTMHFLRSYSNYSGRDRSASESSSVSERCSSRLESVTPERNSEISRQITARLTPEKVISSIAEVVNLAKKASDLVKVKSEPADIGGEIHKAENLEILQKISVKKEFTMVNNDFNNVISIRATNHEVRQKSLTPASQAISPSVSERSLTPKSTSSLSDKKIPSIGSSLNALSSMFDNLNNMNTASINAHGSISTTSTTEETNNNNNIGKKSNANPLAALQKLCETTDPPAANTRSTNNSSHATSHLHSTMPTNSGVGCGRSGVGNMVAFSWACNDAITTPDSIIKCSFCDTPFFSKGAYRHHLSKVHFVKNAGVDEADSQSSNAMKSPGLPPSPKSAASPKSSSKSPVAYHPRINSPSIAPAQPTINPFDESPQSKFLKYTELAKQLSSKNV